MDVRATEVRNRSSSLWNDPRVIHLHFRWREVGSTVTNVLMRTFDARLSSDSFGADPYGLQPCCEQRHCVQPNDTIATVPEDEELFLSPQGLVATRPP